MGAMLTTGVQIAAVILIGLLAGLMVGTGMSAATARSLSAPSWLLRFQAEDALFAKAMPPLMLGTLLLQVAACVLSRGTVSALFGASAVLVFGVLLVTITREVPLNHTFQSWTPGMMPVNWAAMRNQWLRNHLVRTGMGVAAFVLAACGLARVR